MAELAKASNRSNSLVEILITVIFLNVFFFNMNIPPVIVVLSADGTIIHCLFLFENGHFCKKPVFTEMSIADRNNKLYYDTTIIF